MLHGFDISAYQGTTAPAGDFDFVKAGEGGSYTNPKFDAQWASARSRAKVRGAYHFARPEESSGQQQADRLISLARPVPGEMLCLDLEASQLGQAATNAWARAFGDRLRARAPGVRTVLYMGAGYAASGTGKGLASHFDLWWYPQYPSAYQITEDNADFEVWRAANRSSLVDGRTPLAAATSSWPGGFSPWLPSGIAGTGWSRPHIWQFTDNHSGGLDASVSWLTLEQLAGGGQPTPEEDTMLSGSISAGKGPKPGIELAEGGPFKTIKLGCDNTRENPALGIVREAPASIRLAMHVPDRKGNAVTVSVGAALNDPKGWADSVPVQLPAGCDRIDVERNDDGTRPVSFSVS